MSSIIRIYSLEQNGIINSIKKNNQTLQLLKWTNIAQKEKLNKPYLSNYQEKGKVISFSFETTGLSSSLSSSQDTSSR